MAENYLNPSIYVLTVIVVGAILFLLLLKSVLYINEFYKELKYLNSEIRRTRGGERKFWLYKRRRLWLSLIPFVKY
ncbi:MAG: hypothetical protein E7568_05950 [Ruminococcaceae bacterium]|nr:hypothetical protein [Oscillospiraceae bacterium]